MRVRAYRTCSNCRPSTRIRVYPGLIKPIRVDACQVLELPAKHVYVVYAAMTDVQREYTR